MLAASTIVATEPAEPTQVVCVPDTVPVGACRVLDMGPALHLQLQPPSRHGKPTRGPGLTLPEQGRGGVHLQPQRPSRYGEPTTHVYVTLGGHAYWGTGLGKCGSPLPIIAPTQG